MSLGRLSTPATKLDHRDLWPLYVNLPGPSKVAPFSLNVRRDDNVVVGYSSRPTRKAARASDCDLHLACGPGVRPTRVHSPTLFRLAVATLQLSRFGELSFKLVLLTSRKLKWIVAAVSGPGAHHLKKGPPRQPVEGLH